MKNVLALLVAAFVAVSLQASTPSPTPAPTPFVSVAPDTRTISATNVPASFITEILASAESSGALPIPTAYATWTPQSCSIFPGGNGTYRVSITLKAP